MTTTRPTGDKETILREIVDTGSYRKLGWVDPTTGKRHKIIVDVQSAQVMIKAIDLLQERDGGSGVGVAKYTALPWPTMASRAWRLFQ